LLVNLKAVFASTHNSKAIPRRSAANLHIA